MKITITDGSNTVILENNSSIDSAKTRKLLDVLFSVEPTRASRRTPAAVTAEATAVANRNYEPGIPLQAQEFSQWLDARSPTETVNILSALADHNVSQYDNVHSLVNNAPQLASRLGYNRFLQVTEWMHRQGRLGFMPSLASMRTYYRKSIRLAVNA